MKKFLMLMFVTSISLSASAADTSGKCEEACKEEKEKCDKELQPDAPDPMYCTDNYKCCLSECKTAKDGIMPGSVEDLLRE